MTRTAMQHTRPRPLDSATPTPPPNAFFDHVMIVEDHPLFGDALSITLTSLGCVGDIARVETLADALTHCAAQVMPSVVILDLNLPDVEGLDGLIRLKRVVGDVPVLIVSSITQPQIIAAALEVGASGYVPKHSQRAVFAEAFDALSAGRTFLPEGFHLPVSPEGKDDRESLRRLSTLTPQQARILALICNGLLNKQIAYELDIAEATVKAHVTAIMRKLGVQSRTQAVLVAREARFDSVSS